jgi:hypothetical protein
MIVRIRRAPKGARFVHPFDPAPRTAILAPGFCQTPMVRTFSEGWSERARRFNPASVAGPLPLMRRMARDTWTFEQAVIVFTYDGGPGISQ